MKFDVPKEWFVKSAEIEGDSEVGAGHSPFLAPLEEEKLLGADLATEMRLAFGRFVELMRRRHGWTIQRLAEHADVDIGELLAIEKDPHHETELSAVYGLAKVLKVPVRPLIKMAGLAEDRSPDLLQAGLRFAASSESAAPLSSDEEEALHTYLKVVLEDSDKK
jgi:HTH-type transcriptional regulator, competence development regulator